MCSALVAIYFLRIWQIECDYGKDEVVSFTILKEKGRNVLMKKRFLGLLLVVAMVFSLAACSSSGSSSSGAAESTEKAEESAEEEMDKEEEKEEEKVEKEEEKGEKNEEKGGYEPKDMKVVISMKNENEFMNTISDAAEKAAEDAGVESSNISSSAPSDASDADFQADAIEAAINDEADILICACINNDAIGPKLEDAAKAGMTIVMVDTDCSTFADKVTYIGTDNYGAAYAGAKEFAKQLDSGANVAIIREAEGDVNHDNRTNGYKKALEEAGMNVVDVVEDKDASTETAVDLMQGIMNDHEDLDAVMTTADAMALGAAQAIKDADKADDIKVCGFDGIQPVVEMVESGDITMTIAQKPEDMGKMAVECAIGAIGNEKYDGYIDPGYDVITKDNAKDYLKEDE